MDPSLFRDWIRETGTDIVENILANKLTAIVGRNEPKDVFDFHTIVSCAVFKMEDIKTGINMAINSMITGGLNKPWDIASSKDAL